MSKEKLAQILISQIQGTVPFLLEESGPKNQRYREIVRNAVKDTTKVGNDPLAYFELCLAAHFSTVGSFVPTDVDAQIREKLWREAKLENLEQMLALVLEFAEWDILPVGERYVKSLTAPESLSGLDGEWLGIAAAAYAVFRKRDPKIADDLFERIMGNLEKQRRIYFEQVKAHAGLEVMKASYLIAHNLGDLDRVIEIWKIAEDDPLRMAAFRSGHVGSTSWGVEFLVAGVLNKKYMALENHRHFPLREPKALRRKRAFLLPVGPFLDEWGATLAKDESLDERDLTEILTALIKGYFRLNGPVGYAAALRGFSECFRGGISRATSLLPSRLSKDWTSGSLRAECSVPRARFEEKWAGYAFDKKNHR
jgi:hypothetical protein